MRTPDSGEGRRTNRGWTKRKQEVNTVKKIMMIIKYKTDNTQKYACLSFFVLVFFTKFISVYSMYIVTLYTYIYIHFILFLSLLIALHALSLSHSILDDWINAVSNININNHLKFYQHQLNEAWKKYNLPNCLRNKHQFLPLIRAVVPDSLIQILLDLQFSFSVMCEVDVYNNNDYNYHENL